MPGTPPGKKGPRPMGKMPNMGKMPAPPKVKTSRIAVGGVAFERQGGAAAGTLTIAYRPGKVCGAGEIMKVLEALSK